MIVRDNTAGLHPALGRGDYRSRTGVRCGGTWFGFALADASGDSSSEPNHSPGSHLRRLGWRRRQPCGAPVGASAFLCWQLSRFARPRTSPSETRRIWTVVFGFLVLATTAGILVAGEPQPVTVASPGQTEGLCESSHPLDRQLEQATDGLGPSTATAAIYAEYEARWDAELNRTYRLLLTELAPGEQAALRESQRAWLKSRDSDARLIDLFYRPSGRAVPTMYVSAHAYARMNLTRERVLCLIRWRERHAEIAAELFEEVAPSGP